jgi:hypothetical protein
MIERERVEVRNTQLQVKGVTCDRCGKKLRQGSGFVPKDWPFHGTHLRGQLLPDSGNANEIENVEVELCGECTKDVIEFVGGTAYVGTKGRDLVTNLPD